MKRTEKIELHSTQNTHIVNKPLPWIIKWGTCIVIALLLIFGFAYGYVYIKWIYYS